MVTLPPLPAFATFELPPNAAAAKPSLKRPEPLVSVPISTMPLGALSVIGAALPPR
jgi:hypothetical protein